MIYDSHPPYAHHSHLRYAHEPYKFLYVLSRLTTTLLLVPFWVLTYAFLPRRARPRASWSLRQIVQVNFTRRIFKVTELAGVTWGTRNPAEDGGGGKETRFVWADGLDGTGDGEEETLKKGVLRYGGVESGRVGCFVWPKEPKSVMASARVQRKPVIGIFMHGGGYCHMSAHESSRTSRIPRQLIKRNLVDEIYSVEYRLLQHAPFPAALQDAVAVYAHVVRKLYDQAKCTILLIGDSSGGNLALALARWIRDEGLLPMPDGLLLLSPSCDPSHALPETLAHIPSHTHTPRPNEASDYLVDTPEPRALLHRTWLGFSSSHHRKRQMKYGKKYGPNSGTIRLDEEQGLEQLDQLNQLEGGRGRGDDDNDEEEEMEVEDDERELARLRRIVHSEYVSPCSPLVLRRWGHEAVQEDESMDHDDDILPHRYTHNATNAKHTTLFGGFPRTLVICGDAERLTREILALVHAMRRDCTSERERITSQQQNERPTEQNSEQVHSAQNENEHVQLFWARDACHDVLIMPEHGWWVWDRAVIEEVWGAIGRWVAGF